MIRLRFGYGREEPQRAVLIALAESLGYTVASPQTEEAFTILLPSAEDAYYFGVLSAEPLRPYMPGGSDV